MNRRFPMMLTGFSSFAIGVGVAAADPPPVPIDPRPPVAWWAIPSETGHYLGYYVGGGCARPLKGEPRRADEGTWGWDYQGWLIPRRVVLEWWHGRRNQGGSGAYDSVGPKLYHPTK